MPEISTVVVGIKWRGSAALDAVERMSPGDPVRLERENHPKDANAIRVHYLGVWVGYVPRQSNKTIAPAMDAGAAVTAVVEAPAGINRSFIYREPKLKVAWQERVVDEKNLEGAGGAL